MQDTLTVILERAAQGDQEAWKEVVDHYAPRVFGLLRARSGDPETAEEITQSVFCTIAAKLTADEGYVESGRFEAWLFRIALNRFRDEMRRRRRQAVPTDSDHLAARPAAEPPAAPDWAPMASADALRRALNQLNDADREIIELRHRAGLSFRQIADVLDQPLGTVLARQHRALAKLRTILAREVES